MQQFKIVSACLGFLMLLFTFSSSAQGSTNIAPACPNRLYLPTLIRDGEQSSSNPPGLYSAKSPDFNGDGCADLAIGSPYAGFNGGSRQGQVNVVYGGWHGLTPIGNQTWHLDGGYDEAGNSLGDLQGSAVSQDLFGSALATGDFNGDGYSDLAVGVSLENVGAAVNAGTVHIIFGSAAGLTAIGNQRWSQSGGHIDDDGDGTGSFIGDIDGGPEDNDRFAAALAAGDFNGDGYDDLGIGSPNEDIGAIDDAGSVQILYGTANGLTHIGNQFWHQNNVTAEQDGSYPSIGDILGGAEAFDFLGNALTTGDFNGDGFDDLIASAYGEGIEDVNNAGSVHLFHGSETGLVTQNNHHWHGQAAHVDTDGNGTIDINLGNPGAFEEDQDWLGEAVAAGDFNGDGYDDVAVGTPREDLWRDGVEKVDTGFVAVWYGSDTSLTLSNEQYWLQEEGYLIGDLYGSSSDNGDQFGKALAVGDINGDGYADLAISAPHEGFDDSGGDVGSVSVIYGSADRLTHIGAQWFSPNEAVDDSNTQIGDLIGDAGGGYQFGSAVSLIDLNGDNLDELIIGTPRYELPASSDQIGSVHVLLGTSSGAQFANHQFWTVAGGYVGDATANESIGDLWGTAGSYRFGNTFP